MPLPDKLESFIASSFRSVWALELLILLKAQDRPRTTEELVALLRASPSVVEAALGSLGSSGLVTSSGATWSFMPVSREVTELVRETEELYRIRPDRVRRLIVMSSNKGLTAFSDAFRIKD